jgi:aminopeptidase
MNPNLEHQLDQYARLSVEIGLNLRAGQRLFILAPLETAPLVRRIAEHAYNAGSPLVHVVYSDEQLDPIRLAHAPKDSFDEFPEWVASAWSGAIEHGDALISIAASDPDLLEHADPQLVQHVSRVRQERLLEPRQALMRNQSNWLVVSVPIPAWARKVFPDLSEAEALEKLWTAIFKTVRADQPDPVGAWRTHLQILDERRKWLNAQRFSTLHLHGGGTDLTVGLPEGHLWASGQSLAENGILFCANLPTEEVFTMPHKDRVNGVVRSTKPFARHGVSIEGIEVEFKDGKIIRASAQRGEETFIHLLDTDEGARHIGEIALVPHKNPVSDAGILFFNTLFDENAASHIALGRAYPFTLEGGSAMTEPELETAGANNSLIHEDWMIGSDQIDVDGIKPDGTIIPVMRAGEWAER